jgi:hypothetical protein
LEKAVKVLKVMEGNEMSTELDLTKARKSVAGHLAAAKAALSAHKSAHDRLHKAHDVLLDAHKAAHEAQKSAHEARQVHKAAHDAMHAAVGESLDGCAKVLGGGPESIGEFGDPDKITDGITGATNPPSGTPPIATKADIAEMVKAAIADGIKELTKAAAADPAKPVVDSAKPQADAPMSKAETAAEIQKGIAAGLTQIFAEMVKTEEPAKQAGTGRRDAAKPFTKSQDSDPAAVVAVGMTEADWTAYRGGDRKAMAKAQDLTSTKWQEVPARMMARNKA